MKNVHQTTKIHKQVYQTIGLCLMLFFTSISGHTQTYNHTSVWSRLLVSKQVDKWIFTGDIAYRRQNDFHQSKINFMDKPLLDAQRLWICNACSRQLAPVWLEPEIFGLEIRRLVHEAKGAAAAKPRAPCPWGKFEEASPASCVSLSGDDIAWMQC